jgi:hypothetical protein
LNYFCTVLFFAKNSSVLLFWQTQRSVEQTTGFIGAEVQTYKREKDENTKRSFLGSLEKILTELEQHDS